MPYNSPFLETVSLLPSLVFLLLCLSLTLSFVLLLLCLSHTLSLVLLSFFYLICIFLQVFLVNSKKMLYLCERERISNDISNDYTAAKKLLFLCLFQCFIFGCFRYFANTHNWRLVFYIFFHSTRAKRAVTPVNKGLHGVSFVRFFVSICELSRKQNKNVLSTDFTTIIHCNSLINFVFTHQCFRQAAVRCCLPVERGKASGQEEQIIRLSGCIQ